MASKITAEQAQTLPYLLRIPRDGRNLFDVPFRGDDGRFYIVIPGPFRLIDPGRPVASPFLSKVEVDERRDLAVPLLEFLHARCSYPELTNPWNATQNTILSLSTFGATCEVLHRAPGRNADFGHLVQTSIEAFFTYVRSLYDYVNETASHVEKRIGKGGSLADSFHKTVERLRGNPQRYNLPPEMVGFFLSSYDEFMLYANIRDRFVHRRYDMGIIVFVLDRGFAIRPEEPLLEGMQFWLDDTLVMPNRLASVVQLFAYVSGRVMTMLDHFAEALRASYEFPEAIIKAEYHYYLRGPYMEYVKHWEQHWREPWSRPQATRD